jgi:hypothetical protein
MKQLLSLLLLLTTILTNAQDYRVEVDMTKEGYKVFEGENSKEPTIVKANTTLVLDIFDSKNIVQNLKYKSYDEARKQTTDKILKLSDLFSEGKLGLVIKKDGQKMVIGTETENLLFPYYFEILDKDNKVLRVIELGKSVVKPEDDNKPEIEKIQFTSDINILKGVDEIAASPRPNPISKKEKDRRIEKAKEEKQELDNAKKKEAEQEAEKKRKLEEQEAKKQNNSKAKESNENKNSDTKKVQSVFMEKEEDLQNIITEEDIYCPLLKGGDAILLIDFAANKSNTTKLYRKKSDCIECEFECCNKEVRWRDNLKVYIENINPYKYNIKVSSNFKDITPNVQPSLEVPKQISTEAAVNATDEKLQLLFNYQKAAIQLKKFIDIVKANSFPDAYILEQQKRVIINNIYDSELYPNRDIDILYKEINDKDYYDSYLIAKQFNQLYYEMYNLTYIVLGSEIPINIRSFDVLILKLGLYDSNNKLLREEEFNYLIRGGFKVDQSFGVALHTIRDTEFSLRSFMDKDTSYAMHPNGERIKILLPEGNSKDSISSITSAARKEIMKEESPSQFAIGATTLTHLYYRWTGVFSVGPEIGISADIYPKTELRYLLGAGVLFKDERHRISIDVGYAFGKSMSFSEGQNYGTILKGDQATPALIDKHRAKLYFGISYNVPLGTKNTQDEKL